MADAMNMNGFEGLNSIAAPATGEDAKKAAQNEAKKAAIQATKAAYAQKLTEDPDFKDKVGSEKGNLEVTKCLRFGMKGLIEKKKGNKETGEKREIEAVPENVGYRVKNIGNVSYRYTTDVWTKNEAGEYVSSPVEKELTPGMEVDMQKTTFFNFLSNTQFGLATSNGSAVVKGAAGGKSIKEVFKSAYFVFNKELNINVHDDAVGVEIGDYKAGTLLPQFEEEFGFLLNKPASKKKGTGKKAEKASGAAMLTALIQQRKAEEGIL